MREADDGSRVVGDEAGGVFGGEGVCYCFGHSWEGVNGRMGNGGGGLRTVGEGCAGEDMACVVLI